ncbi:hypothetical protein SAE02_61410 [Skermanella aerolata]|uniref:Uncharacterized protein n=1 Tax=Skermanella aerolata TaxID=393310 RepID=A0A512DZT2_9PROT|nr:hypothetical protein [Skermanella aerolata]KJB91900.1 hypothetical protein N826_25625 [Skermanella aerolata KACC 11604]GEO41993.1 hypothetical protein SAE02_61410 [Skermanella aerolata]
MPVEGPNGFTLVGKRSEVLGAIEIARIATDLVSRHGLTSIDAVIAAYKSDRTVTSPTVRDIESLASGVIARMASRQDLDGGKMALLTGDASLGAGSECRYF